jgi:hypothetical protein
VLAQKAPRRSFEFVAAAEAAEGGDDLQIGLVAQGARRPAPHEGPPGRDRRLIVTPRQRQRPLVLAHLLRQRIVRDARFGPRCRPRLPRGRRRHGPRDRRLDRHHDHGARRGRLDRHHDHGARRGRLDRHHARRSGLRDG